MRMLLCMMLPILMQAQTYTVSGTVLDRENNEPLAFAGVSIPGSKVSVLTDISGRFTVSASVPIKYLQVRFIGYETVTLSVKDPEKPLVIKLRPQVHHFDEVIIFPGENPAHRIIRRVMDNKEKNDPYTLKSFHCLTYSKMYVTGEFPADTTTQNLPDSLSKAKKFFSRQHLFMTETVSEKKYKKPGKENEKVLGSRVSGFSGAPFFTPVTQLQSFSFYSAYITILDRSYVNPLAPGTFNRYFFLLEDTLYTDEGDSVYIVSFRPAKGRNFEAMKGLLYVHTKGYALSRVIAEPVDVTGVISPRIEQEYAFTEGHWFPKELHTDWYYNNMKLTDSTAEASMKNFSDRSLNKVKVVCRTWISKVVFDSLQDPRFSSDQVFAMEGYDSRDSSFWSGHRKERLDEKDQRTYAKLDSVGKVKQFDRKMDLVEALATGRLPLGYVDLELKQLFRFNEVEKFRPGIGLVTSKKISRVFSAGVYGAYGAGDKRFKYGGNVSFKSASPHEFSMGVLYRFDLLEPGKTDWYEKYPGLDGSSIREYNIPWLEWEEKLETRLSFRIRNHLKIYLHAGQRSWRPDSGVYGVSTGPVQVSRSGTQENFTVVQVRWQHHEKFLNSRFGRNGSGSKWPELFLRWERGFGTPPLMLQHHPEEEWLQAHDKFSIRLEWKLRTRTLGVSSFRFEAGTITGRYSLSHAFIPSGSYRRFGFFADGTFENMRYNEFAADDMLMLFHTHDFGKISRKRSFNPSIVLVNALAWGRGLEHSYTGYGLAPVIPEKPYLESGIRLNALLRNQFIGLGLQAMYRYGYHAFPDFQENYTLKSTLSIVF